MENALINDYKNEKMKQSFKGVRKTKTSIKRKNKKLSLAKKKKKQK